MSTLWLLAVLSWACLATGTRLGLSTSSYQIEGASDVRGVHVWDVFSHTPGKVSDGTTGDVACDHYHRWREDVENVAWLRAGYYRFSLSWTRLFPTEGNLSAAGVSFYNGLIDALLSRNVTPLVTLHHWDLPQVYQDRFGGWQSLEIVAIFRQYAEQCFALFGDRVHLWLTLNEPLTVATLGYGSGYHAPGVSEPARAPYVAAYHMLLAHAEAYRAFHEGGTYTGSVGVALNSDFVMPRDPASPDDAAAAKRGLLWRVGWFADPLFFGRFPEEMLERCGERLAPLNVSSVAGTLDFFALNHYTTLVAWPDRNGEFTYFRDAEAAYDFPPGSPASASPWLHVYPEGIYHLIGWLCTRYNLSKLPLYVTESGVSTSGEDREDHLRQFYVVEYLRNLVRAASDFAVEVPAYCVWSLMDNFEWAEGFSQRFGLFSVNFNTYVRTPRTSAWIIRELVNTTTGHLAC